ncbi:MFS transporter [Phyllobacterium myrsinacearum]|uniref:Putative MFS family arabinose efflux permease n=1 Tax=Phyllobacterium myrsinacearum TaxID=28101 RepID=A0A839EML3_9HYPH|nr:MFS transporter [Phyllobacterium myrsinacearum]MBA8880069.1 putative MFS family arabinose efflux permease [Phyllobacterium myrsinacearum]
MINSAAADSAVKKATWRLLPFLGLMLVLNFLDRANVGFAKNAFQADTGISDAAYAFGAGILYIGYAAFEVPSNLILQRVGARFWLGRIMITWGIVSACMVFAHDAMTYYIIRFLLGVCEAGFYPGVLLYLTYWFPAKQRARATGLFYLGVPFSLVIGSPLSGWLLTHHNVLGLTNWQWMFAVEGLAATVVGVVALFFLTSKPSQASWLTDEEKHALTNTIELEELGKLDTVRHTALGVLRDWRVLTFVGIYLFIQIGVGPLTFYFPARLGAAIGNGVDVSVGLLLALPWLCALIATRFFTVFADRRDNHRLVCICMITSGTIALGVVGLTMNPVIMVIAACVAVSGLAASQPVFWSLPTRYLGGIGAASGIAFIVALGNLGSFASPQIKAYIDNLTGNGDAGFYVLSALSFLAVILLILLRPGAGQLSAAVSKVTK